MLNKKIVLIAAALIGVLPAYSQELLENGSFEEFKTSTSMGINKAAFTSWSLGNAFASNVDSTDVIDGKYAFITNSAELKKAAVLYQSVDCSNYAVADSFKIRICYKNLNDSTLRLCSYWTASAGSDPIAEDSALNQELPYSSEWDTVEIITAKPEGARNFEFRIEVKRLASVMFDNFSFAYVIPSTPYFTVLPDKSSYSFTSILGSDTTVARLVIRQYNLTQPVQLLWSVSTDKTKYSVSKTAVTAEIDTVEVRFHASEEGKFDASLNISNDESKEASIYNTSVSFAATVVDTAKAPIITITPLEFDTFRCKAYETVTDTFVIKSENCYDYVHVVVDDETGPDWAFGISESFFLKNSIDTVVITFAPKKEGVYTARYKAYTTGLDTIFFSTVGVASEGKPEPIIVDWDTAFVWNTNNPYTILNEDFSHADTCRNKTIKTTDWQNVVTGGQRPWWGYYSDSTTQAKMVSFYSDADSATCIDIETWLVTPALDYKNTTDKVFMFSVMSDLIFEGQTGKLALFFINPADPNNIRFMHVEAADELIPANDSELGKKWVPIVMDLSKVQGLPDVFFMAFRFTDSCGGKNGVVYYITNVSWGIQPSGIVNVNANENANHMSDVHKFVYNGQLVIIKDGKRYNVLGQLQ